MDKTENKYELVEVDLHAPENRGLLRLMERRVWVRTGNKTYSTNDSVYEFGHVESSSMMHRNTDRTLYQIRAVKSFWNCNLHRNVEVGELGGYVHGEHNLSQEGGCWITDLGMALEASKVSGDSGVSKMGLLFEDARIEEQVRVTDLAIVQGCAYLSGDGCISEEGIARDFARTSGHWVIKGTLEHRGKIEDSSYVLARSICRGYMQNSTIMGGYNLEHQKGMKGESRGFECTTQGKNEAADRSLRVDMQISDHAHAVSLSQPSWVNGGAGMSQSDSDWLKNYCNKYPNR